jgi:hypothetical protein
VCGLGESIIVGAPGQQEDACSRPVDPIKAIDPSDLNYPSIAVGDLAGSQTITRTVRNTTNQASVYVAKVEAPPGFSVTVRPSVLTVLPRASATYTVEVSRTTATYGTFVFGALTFADTRGHSVRSPLAMRAAQVATPTEVIRSGTGSSGTVKLLVRAEDTSTLTAKPFGLAASTVSTRRVTGNASFDPGSPAVGPGVAKVEVTIPPGSKAGRVATYMADYGPEKVYQALFVYRPGGEFVGSNFMSSREAVDLPPGTYTVYLVRYFGGGPTLDLKLHTFVVGPTAGNLTATPASQPATVGRPVTVTAGWSGLTAGTKYLGVIEYADGARPLGTTLITVDA